LIVIAGLIATGDLIVVGDLTGAVGSAETIEGLEMAIAVIVE